MSSLFLILIQQVLKVHKLKRVKMYEIVFMYVGYRAWPPAYPLLNEKHSHLASFIIWESLPIANDSHLKDFNTCKVFSFENDSYSRIFLIWYTTPATCQSVRVLMLIRIIIIQIPGTQPIFQRALKTSQFVTIMHIALPLEVLQRCNTLLHFITL